MRSILDSALPSSATNSPVVTKKATTKHSKVHKLSALVKRCFGQPNGESSYAIPLGPPVNPPQPEEPPGFSSDSEDCYGIVPLYTDEAEGARAEWRSIKLWARRINFSPKEFRYTSWTNDAHPDTIRLLRRSPGTGSRSLLQFVLIETRLSTEASQFIALSYQWHTPELYSSKNEDKWILVNGLKFIVRSNLYGFLRSRAKMKCTQQYWIDAICIDQSTVQERNHQVGMMKEIYQAASCVYIWLGYSNKRCSWIFPEFSNVADEVAQQEHFNQSNFNRSNSVVSVGPRSFLSNHSYIEQARSGFDQISSDRYWKRLWIVQECLVAKRVVLWMGKKSIPWENLARLGRFLRPETFDETGFGKMVEAKARAEHWTLQELLRKFSSSSCTVAHDRIFALTGISSDMEDFSEIFRIDYSEPLQSLLARAFKFISDDYSLYAFQDLASQLGITQVILNNEKSVVEKVTVRVPLCGYVGDVKEGTTDVPNAGKTYSELKVNLLPGQSLLLHPQYKTYYVVEHNPEAHMGDYLFLVPLGLASQCLAIAFCRQMWLWDRPDIPYMHRVGLASSSPSLQTTDKDLTWTCQRFTWFLDTRAEVRPYPNGGFLAIESTVSDLIGVLRMLNDPQSFFRRLR